MKKYLITNWYGVPLKFILNKDKTINYYRIDQMKDAGLNLLMLPDYGYEINKKILKYCEKISVQVIYSDKRVEKLFKENKTIEADKVIKQITDEYKNFKAIQSYYIIDEPSSLLFPRIKEIIDAFRKYDSDKETYINIFPNFANLKLIGEKTYEDYLEKYVSLIKPDIICYDHYDLLKKQYLGVSNLSTEERESLILQDAFEQDKRPGYFLNLEQISSIGKKYNLPTMLIILLVSHGPYKNVTLSEIYYQAFQSMCYNMMRLSYFTYWTPGLNGKENDKMWKWNNGLISKNGRKTKHYYDVKKANETLSQYGNILVNQKYKYTRHIGLIKNQNVTYYQNDIEDIKILGAKALTIGVFDKMYLISNKYVNKKQAINISSNKKLSCYSPLTHKWERVSFKNVVIEKGNAILFKVED